MDWSTTWPSVLADTVGPPQRVRSLGPDVWQVAAGGRLMVVKTGVSVPDEAAGLRRLGSVKGGPGVPEVIHDDGVVLVMAWIEPGPMTPLVEEDLGRGLAGLHLADPGRPALWGGGSSWIGKCPVDPGPSADAPSFYGARLAQLAARCGLEAAVGAVVDRLSELIPESRPSLLHGDLWWGNVISGADGRPYLIDPSDHLGHREEDLGMLALFGPLPDALLGAYRESFPLTDGWESRVALWQLYPLLVHSVLFGGSYRRQAEEVARRYA